MLLDLDDGGLRLPADDVVSACVEEIELEFHEGFLIWTSRAREGSCTVGAVVEAADREESVKRSRLRNSS